MSVKLFLLLVLSLPLARHTCAAQDIVSDFSARTASSYVSFNYAFKLRSSTPVTGNGAVAFMGSSYRMNGNGLEIWSDGQTRWTVDHSSKEVYVETVDDSAVDYVSNPALLIRSVGTVFTRSSSEQAVFNGKSATAVTLLPSVSGTGLKSVILYFASDSVPVGAVIGIDDGTVTEIVLKDFKFSTTEGRSFVYDMAALDSAYLVTDLR